MAVSFEDTAIHGLKTSSYQWIGEGIAIDGSFRLVVTHIFTPAPGLNQGGQVTPSAFPRVRQKF
jgi:hypothetical protein